MKQNKKIKLKVPSGYKFEELYDTEDIEFGLGHPIFEEEVGIEFGKE